MDITDFSKPLTSKALNENLAKQFGYRVDLAQFSNTQLEDARNKLRTKVSQFEMTESYGGMLKNTDYQKTKALLDIINQQIFEREMSSEEKAKESKLKKKYDASKMKGSMKKQYGSEKGKNVYFATIRKRAMDESIPESWIDSAIERIDLGESSNNELKAELKLRYDVSEQQASWMLCEGEELRAEIIIATRDMVDNITRWIEDVSSMKAEQLLELVDSIKEELGANIAQQYQEILRPALDNMYNMLEQTRQEINQSLMVVSGGETEVIGTPVDSAASSASGMAAPSEPLAPPSTELDDRAKRESVEYSRRLSEMLNSKKKKLMNQQTH